MNNQVADLLPGALPAPQSGVLLLHPVYQPDGMLTDLRLGMLNPQAERDTAQPISAIEGQSLRLSFPQFINAPLLPLYQDVLDTGLSARFECPADSTQTTPLPGYEVSATRLADNLLLTYADLSQARQHAQLMEVIQGVNPAGVVLFDPVWDDSCEETPRRIVDFIYTAVNKTELEITRKPADQLIGHRLKTVCPSAEAFGLVGALIEAVHTNQPTEWLMPYFGDGISGWFQSAAVRHGEQVLFTFLEVTELKQHQEALEMAIQELRRANDNLQQFAYVASHDLQEPLRKIQSFGNMLAVGQAATLDASTQDLIQRMQAAAKRMSVLISDLLTYSRLTTQQEPFRPVSLTNLLPMVLTNLTEAITESGAQVNWSELPTINGDPAQLEQLFDNLLANAIKFRHTDTVPIVTVSADWLLFNDIPQAVRARLPNRLLQQPGQQTSFWAISITDNGIGFDEKYLNRIFVVFQRLHGKNRYPGTGIGLAICQKIVDNHGGAITATSAPGQGSTFTVYLPARGQE
ncbi:sensor histidine kinase [Fibrella aestuarina]|nr:ATP-binding protein [Fibrella aestuarina]